MNEEIGSSDVKVYNEPTVFQKIKYRLTHLTSRAALFLAILIVGAALGGWISVKLQPSKMIIYKAGAVSVSLNERGELTFIDRTQGVPILVDSTLTEAINNIMASREYVRSGKTIKAN